MREKLLQTARRVPAALFQRPQRDCVHRLVVIDGCNVGRASCGPGRENVNCLGLLAMARFWIVRDFDVVIFIPATYNNPQNQNVAHCTILPVGWVGFGGRHNSGHRSPPDIVQHRTPFPSRVERCPLQ